MRRPYATSLAKGRRADPVTASPARCRHRSGSSAGRSYATCTRCRRGTGKSSGFGRRRRLPAGLTEARLMRNCARTGTPTCVTKSLVAGRPYVGARRAPECGERGGVGHTWEPQRAGRRDGGGLGRRGRRDNLDARGAAGRGEAPRESEERSAPEHGPGAHGLASSPSQTRTDCIDFASSSTPRHFRSALQVDQALQLADAMHW